MGIFTKIFGNPSQKEMARLQPIVDEIVAKKETYVEMDNDELAGMTDKLKQRLEEGETLDEILPDAFAVCREASRRVLGMEHYPVQLLGGLVLHRGNIAEMKTGEGKTLVATLPVYLNALSGKGVHVVTVNDYLAKRDSEWMGAVYKFLGLSVGLVVHGLDNEERQLAYNSDITYGTNNELGFDYLRDNMVQNKESMVQRGHNYAIVDEVDSILVDEARTPLIISGPGTRSTDDYKRVSAFVKTLKVKRIAETDSKVDYDSEEAIKKAGISYIVDEKQRNATLTALGIKKAERYFNVENLADAENMELSHLINQAIKAHGVMRRDVDYVVQNGQVIIVDEHTGRLMMGRRYNDGLHQSIEAKENVKVERESKTLATITFQNFFRMYKKLAGMTGTAKTEEDEFNDIYGLQVIEIPTNRPMVREDHSDTVYKTKKAKYDAVIEQVIECHEKEQPVLVGTISIETSELLSKRLAKKGIKHSVLNAKKHEEEAMIVSQAGRSGSVTIATNMAGRGTDIILGGNAETLAEQDLLKRNYTVKQTEAAKAYIRLMKSKIELEGEGEDELSFAEMNPELAEAWKENLVYEFKRDLETEETELKAEDLALRASVKRNQQNLKTKKDLSAEAKEDINESIEKAEERLKEIKDRLEEIPVERIEKNLEKQADEQINALDFFIKQQAVHQQEAKEDAEKVIEAGGLFIIGTERHESRRIDNQLRGRSGRQGDPGESRFYLSMEDDLMRLFGGERMQNIMDTLGVDDDMPIENKMITGQIESAQRKIEGRNYEMRKNVLSFDDVMNSQREIIYGQRAEVLSGEDVSERIHNMMHESIENTVLSFCAGDDPEEWNLTALRDHYLGWLTKEGDFEYSEEELDDMTSGQVAEKLIERADAVCVAKEKALGEEEMRRFERFVLLHNVDRKWMDHIDAMEELRRGIYLRGYAQRDPVVEYRLEGFEMFDEMVESIREDTTKMILTMIPANQNAPRKPIVASRGGVPKAGAPAGRVQGKPAAASAGGKGKKKQAAPKKKPGRNDPCYCGSGKKYKNCHWDADQLT